MTLIKVKSVVNDSSFKYLTTKGITSIFKGQNFTEIEYNHNEISKTKSSVEEVYQAIQDSKKEFQELQKLREENSLLSKRVQEMEENLSSGNKVFYNPDEEEFNKLRNNFEDKVRENEMLKDQVEKLEMEVERLRGIIANDPFKK